jgi:hypothetical protein
LTAGELAAAVKDPNAFFSATAGHLTENSLSKKRRFSANGKCKRAQAVTLAENAAGLVVNVDDQTLFGLIAADRVGVHKNGSRQRKRGRVYDYRQRWRVLRRNDGGREVLAFGTQQRLAEKLASLGGCVCFDHYRPVLTVGNSCRTCGGRGAGAVAEVSGT